MGSNPWVAISRFQLWRKIGPWIFLIGLLGFVRWTKGAVFADAYAFAIRPFWPGSSQREWVQNSTQIEQLARLQLLEKDNQRLREMLSIKSDSKSSYLAAAVISRRENGWWQQIELGKGSLSGIKSGDAVTGPGGLLGIIESVTPTTSRVKLLTAPGSRIGVWTARTKRHGILLGVGSNRPKLLFLDTDPQSLPGDLISTSPASTLLPPNLPVGVVQFVENQALPAPYAFIQLLASPEAIDWVQIKQF